MDGVVLEKLVDSGELVSPQSFGGTRGPSTALVAVADPKDLQVKVQIRNSDNFLTPELNAKVDFLAK